RPKARYFHIVVQQVRSLGHLVVLAGEELLLIVESRTPGERRANLEIFTERVPHHVFRSHTLRWLGVVRAACGVNVVISRPPAELGGIDPPFYLKGGFLRTGRR